ncbi:SgcJ/EcaC family oxidoreductase [Jannaschia sp. R86511]|uniref:SgcJ/EcaC family oxidoreductase n=1 Tax=Jannaschia sp. R86511 TaxID=3093853 RepID=UPI0036D32424
MPVVTEKARSDTEAVVVSAPDAQDDVEALLALHTADAIVANIAGRRVLGREAFARAMAAALTSPLAQVRATVEVMDVRLAPPDAAMVSSVKTARDGHGDGDHPPVPAWGALTHLLVHADRRWRIASAQTTPLTDPLRSPS